MLDSNVVGADTADSADELTNRRQVIEMLVKNYSLVADIEKVE